MSAADDRIELLREMMLQPLRDGMRNVAAGAVESSAFRMGAWHGYRLAVGIFERWLGMTGKCSTGGRFAVHLNPLTERLPAEPLGIGDWTDGRWQKAKEDGGSCNG